MHKPKDFKNFHVSGQLLNLRRSNYLHGSIQTMCIQIHVPGKSPLIYRLILMTYFYVNH